MLVGGGELHERWSSLVGVSAPLGRGIQRFTGITQAMVDEAPPPEAVLPELAAQLEGRVLVAHSARFDVGVLKQAFERAALEWPDPPVMCTVALARRLAPLQRRRGLRSLADALGIEVAVSHRALPDAETCARVLCALLPRLCANARTVGEGLALLRPRKPPRFKPAGARRTRDERPDLSALPKDPGVYIFRDADGRPLYVGKSVCLRTRARAHFTTPSTWTGQAEHVDYQPTESELGALVLENRLIKALRPPGNTLLKKQADGYVYLRCRLDIPFPILEVAREPAAGHAVCVGPVRGRAAAAELVEQLNSLFGLRHCGRGLPQRQHPSAYGQMGRCLSPCLGDLDPNLYRERLDRALRAVRGRRQRRAARARRGADARGRRPSGATSARRGCAAAASACSRCWSGSAGRCARRTRARGSCSPRTRRTPAAPTRSGSSPAASPTGGRSPATPSEVAARTRSALATAPAAGLGGWLPADELDETRLVGLWLAGHADTPVLELDRGADEAALSRLTRRLAA